MSEKENYISIKERDLNESRIQKLHEVVEDVRQEFSEEELEPIDAILVYGSTGRGKAKQESDIDLFICLKDKSSLKPKILKKLIAMFEEKIPEYELQFNMGVILEKGRATRSVTVRSAKHRGEVSNWRFIYVKNSDVQAKLNDILERSRSFFEKIRYNM